MSMAKPVDEASLPDVTLSVDLATCDVGGNILLLSVSDAQSTTVVKRLPTPVAGVSCMAFSPCRRYLAVGLADFTVRIWDLRVCLLMRSPIVSFKGAVSTLAFSSDSKYLVSGSKCGRLSIICMTGPHAAGRPSFLRMPDVITSVAFVPHSRVPCVVIALMDGRVLTLEVGEDTFPGVSSPQLGVAGRHLERLPSALYCMACSPDSGYYAVGDRAGCVHLLSAHTNAQLATLQHAQAEAVRHVLFVSGGGGGGGGGMGELQLVGATASVVQVWSLSHPLQHSTVRATLPAVAPPLYGLALSPSGRLLAVAEDDGYVRLWHTRTWQSAGRIAAYAGPAAAAAGSAAVRGVAWAPARPMWTRESHHCWPPAFRAVVRTLVRGLYAAGSRLHLLPLDVLELIVGALARSP